MFQRLKAPEACRDIAIMPKSVRATWLDEIRGTGRNANDSTEPVIHSLPQLLDFLAKATNRLIDLMKFSGTAVLVRTTRNEIVTLKAAIVERRIF
jgi:hypothetical protein